MHEETSMNELTKIIRLIRPLNSMVDEINHHDDQSDEFRVFFFFYIFFFYNWRSFSI